MRTVTRLALRTRVRQRADIENNVGFISDAEINDHINEGIAELHDLVVGTAWGEEYFTKSQTIVTVSGTALYTLAADFYKLRGVDLDIGGGRKLTLRQYEWNERNRFSVSAQWNWTTRAFYRLRGIVGAGLPGVAHQIHLIPDPSGAFTLTVWYIPVAALLTADGGAGGEFNGEDGWEEHVVLDAAIKCKIKGEEDISELAALKGALAQRIVEMAADRDVGLPSRIVDMDMIVQAEWWGYPPPDF